MKSSRSRSEVTSKLKLAQELTRKPSTREEYLKDYSTNLQKGIKIYSGLCLNPRLTIDNKLKVMASFLKAVPDEGKDMLIRWRDMLPFLKNKDLDQMLDLLVKITRSPEFDSHERVITAVALYNNGFIDVCHNCFADLACDRSVLVNYRAEASRYLFATEDEEYKQAAQEALLEIVDTTEYPSDYRYRIIAGFISKTGISTTLNMQKIRVPYDEEFVYGLQTNFFYNNDNGVRERIVSGQHMLQMACVDEKEKQDVCQILLEIAGRSDLSENARADAADVVLREGAGDQKKDARNAIISLGRLAVGGGSSGIASSSSSAAEDGVSEGTTLYQDSQNIHYFMEQVETFIEKIINETDVRIRSYPEVHQEVCNVVRKYVKDPAEKFNAFKALNRIGIDTATFTRHRVNLAEIFVHVWIRINGNYEGDIQEELRKRMAEELVDMGDTCSTGHAGRFVNVLSGYDDSLRISWEEQIIGNVNGRMQARIRDCQDHDLREKLAMAVSELAEEEDKLAYREFVESSMVDLRAELELEFVSNGYVTQEEFEAAFAKGMSAFLG